MSAPTSKHEAKAPEAFYLCLTDRTSGGIAAPTVFRDVHVTATVPSDRLHLRYAALGKKVVTYMLQKDTDEQLKVLMEEMCQLPSDPKVKLYPGVHVEVRAPKQHSFINVDRNTSCVRLSVESKVFTSEQNQKEYQRLLATIEAIIHRVAGETYHSSPIAEESVKNVRRIEFSSTSDGSKRDYVDAEESAIMNSPHELVLHESVCVSTDGVKCGKVIVGKGSGMTRRDLVNFIAGFLNAKHAYDMLMLGDVITLNELNHGTPLCLHSIDWDGTTRIEGLPLYTLSVSS
jgi:hypothetical protein